MKNYNNDEIIRFFEDAGYNNVSRYNKIKLVFYSKVK